MNAHKELLQSIKNLAAGRGIEHREALRMTCRTVLTMLCWAFHQAKVGETDRFEIALLPDFDFEFDMKVGDQGDLDEQALGAANAYLQAVRESEPFADILSDLHMHLSGGNRLAQHFTPSNLCKGMSKFMAPVASRELAEARATPLSIADPTCGAGGLLLAQIAGTIAIDGTAVVGRLHVVGNDIDPLCALMTSTQIFSNELIHGAVLGAVCITVGNVISEYCACKVFHQSVRHGAYSPRACVELLLRLEQRLVAVGAAGV